MKKFLLILLLIILSLAIIFRAQIINLSSRFFSSASVPEVELQNAKLENENAYLKSILSNATITQSFADSGIIDPIVANGTFFDKVKIFYSDIILNKGEVDGVKQGSLVFVRGSKPVGTIKEVYDGSSKLELFTSYKKITEGYTNKSASSSSTSSEAVTFGTSTSLDLIGDGSFGFYSRVLKTFPAEVGDEIFLKNYPTLVVATIKKVEDIENENEKILYLKSNFDNSNIRLFFIEK